jgi:hypothetical protein
MSHTSHTTTPPPGGASASPAQRHAALFTGMVLQQANLALMCLGRTPRPDTKDTAVDLDSATLFIDTLEMLEAKTRGNLSAEEATMLRETLTSLRITFVEAADRVPARGSAPTPTPAAPATTPEGTSAPAGSAEAAAETEERKKFVKRY